MTSDTQQNQPTVIETAYDGVTYRSRTEARWAVFFHALGVDVEYESETYKLDGAWYLPDFYILAWQMFVEIKGEIPTPFERERCRKLCALTKKRVFLISGAPGSQRHGELFDPEEPWKIYYAAFAECRACGGLSLEYWSEDGCSWGAHLLGEHKYWDRCGEKIGGNRNLPAVIAAKDERFGVYPRPAA